MAEIFDELFDSLPTFVEYMRKNDSAKLRERLLVTDRLKYWYCRHVCCRESVLMGIDPENIDTPNFLMELFEHMRGGATYLAEPCWAFLPITDGCDAGMRHIIRVVRDRYVT